ncbi:MAG: AMP-binding protein [Albidovulum sp.]|nr:AMP-binding protein [Albidovulum sp.]MDE0306128.1 AMP-binding protein [Albidovulum sp.]MDE0531837.1 AMP-binding protein [Albidovulum sp.]
MGIQNGSLAESKFGNGADANTVQANFAPHDGLSYVRGPANPPLAERTVSGLLRDAASRFGSRDAAIFCQQRVRLSYRDLDRAVDRLAAGLLALGLNKGDRLGIWSPNRVEWVVAQFATARIGVLLVNINPAYRLSELEYVLNAVGCRALMLARRFKSSDYVGMIRKLAPNLESSEPGRLDSERVPNLRHVIVMGDDPVAGAWSFDGVCNLGGREHALRLSEIDGELSPHDAINIQFTSGTTGNPKGATLTHFNIVNNARFVTDRIQLSDIDRLAIPVPLYHCFGMVMGVLGAVSKCATLVFPGEGFDPEATLNALEQERCTAVYGVPTMFVAMLQELDSLAPNLSTLRTGIMAGAPCPIEIMQRVNREMNLTEITICYGMTETSPVSFQSFVDDPTRKRCETVGRVHPHLEVKIVDKEGVVVPVGAQGELCTRGYAVMKGYWEDDQKTTDAIRDGWMHTGDLATLDSEGYCSITGRVKDMIIRGGENIYPREIEEFLFRHPKVSEAQVFGIPDEKFGEEVCAWVVGKPDVCLTVSELCQFCEGQIAHFKIPRHFRVVGEIPMTITGKPQKFVMRERMVEELMDSFRDVAID